MSHIGHSSACSQSHFSKRTPTPRPSRLAASGRWISRHRAEIEAVVTIGLAMTTPILAAVSTLQT
jgi:hypothetical protein